MFFSLVSEMVGAQTPRYEVRYLPTSQEAQASLERYRGLLRDNPDTRRAEPCEVAKDAPQSRCLDIGGKGGDLVLPPPPTLARAAFEWTYEEAYFLIGLGLGHGLEWLPAEEVRDPKGIAAKLRSMQPKPYGCNNEGMCLVVERAFNHPIPQQLSYALCERTASSTIGPPRFCVPMATLINGHWWYLAWQKNTRMGGSGRTDFTFEVQSTNGQAAKFRKNLLAVLSAPPWSLRDEGRGDVLVGAADRRPSKIVPPLREHLTIRIDFNPWSADDANNVNIEVTTTIYVNPLNTSASEDWHLPKPEVEQRYLAALRKAIQKAALMDCTTPRWEGNSRVYCGEH